MQSGESPWMGHDPDPWIEWAGAVVRVWSDGAITTSRDRFAVEFERERFVAELGRVEEELRAFLPRVAEWAREIAFPDPVALCHKLDDCFKITAGGE